MSTLIMIRHGESEWNAKGLFTGWVDARLSERGRTEAGRAGQQLADAGLRPEVVHTSVLIRAIETANIALDVAGLGWLPVRRSWRLNERHYGALQGKDKAQTRQQYGDEQFLIWRTLKQAERERYLLQEEIAEAPATAGPVVGSPQPATGA